ncbi:MAG: leucine--tRNA ligase [Candidatus Kerfeldbacteria bacterium]|nr:leucine--tRNA ligase [Candidatus Kerfeldbacteria bacterium]
MELYQPNVIEPKWQAYWRSAQLDRADDDSAEQKFYCLDMFPYPSAQGLHVGHPEGYTATDIMSRWLRMTGHNVLHPMGWDAFGLPAENYAIKSGVHPDTSTHNNIITFTRQIQGLGLSYDWDRVIDTSSPEYYKWTQWMFLQMYQHGLAYKKRARVNWCDSCQTVLANEQVIDGKCERSQDAVVQKDLEQWFFKITDYAEQLLNDLEIIDWPEPIKIMQRNWIGRSEGADIEFRIKNHELSIKVYTTRPDTLFGATYMVLAPDHPLVEKITTKEKSQAVRHYQEDTIKKTELERTSLQKEKTGVFTGAYAINPANQNLIPVWIADYVLSSYGTGAIMAVPAHDERDAAFAQHYDLAVQVVVNEMGKLQQSNEFDNLDSEIAKWKITEKVGGVKKVNYKMRDWLISRQRYWGAPIPIVYDPQGQPHPVKVEHLPLVLPTDVDYTPKGTSPLGSSVEYQQRAEQWYGKGWRFEVDTMDTFVCSSWYYLRYCDPHNAQEFAAYAQLAQWLPVDMYVGGAEHAVLHLLYARFFHKALQDFGYIPKQVGREPFKALRNQGMILGEDHQKMSKSRGNVINPDDIVNEFGADTLRLYEMFMGPFEDVKPWNTSSIRGVRRFLERVWKFYQNNLAHGIEPNATNQNIEIVLKQTINKITDDIKNFKFNTAISQLMICLNGFNEQGGLVNTGTLIQYLQLLYPFVPHIAEELRNQCQFGADIFQAWPERSDHIEQVDDVTITIHINGKRRDQLAVAPNADESAVKERVDQSEKIQKLLAGKKALKVIYVPGKIYNIIVQ